MQLRLHGLRRCDLELLFERGTVRMTSPFQ
jgi:hypothetical protein